MEKKTNGYYVWRDIFRYEENRKKFKNKDRYRDNKRDRDIVVEIVKNRNKLKKRIKREETKMVNFSN